MSTAIVASDRADVLHLIGRELERDIRLQSPHTRRGYLHDLIHFEAWRAGRQFTLLLVEEYAAHLLAAGRVPTGVNRALAAVRWWARRLGSLANEDPSLAAESRQGVIEHAARVAALQDVRGGPRDKVGRHVGIDEIDAMMLACARDPSGWGRRDSALIALGVATGARRFELANLQLADWSIGEDGAAVIIRGKGGKLREVPVYNGAARAVTDWLSLRGQGPGPLFCAIRRGGALQIGKGITTEAMAQLLARRAQQAGIVPLRWHDLRRTLAGDLLDQGADVVTVGRILGHASPTTTARYDRRPEETRRRVLRNRHVPYHARKG